MIRDHIVSGRLVQGLRTKYFPKSRINQGLISIGPWINIVLLVMMFMMLNNRMVVQSGYTVDLPAVGSVSAVQPSLLAVVKYFEAAGDFEAGERVFFQDDAFVLGNDRHMGLLRNKLKEAAAQKDASSLLLYADKEVSNERLAQIFLVLREAGIESVSLALSKD